MSFSDYNLLKSLLKQILKKENHSLADPYDWEPNAKNASKFNRFPAHLMKSKASDEKFVIDKSEKSDVNTRMGIKTIMDEVSTYNNNNNSNNNNNNIYQ
ncbi:unnamed protein product, partial [Brugia timori]|uniref:INCENP_ARK-bind domain-containing protein n=1 Tax=Brugia timori TaxID=42155 RepID=A0A0R3RDH6_9BILA